MIPMLALPIKAAEFVLPLTKAVPNFRESPASEA